MRLGLLGLGRIGAFHAETLAGLPAVEELESATRSRHWPNGLPDRSARGSPEAPGRC
jgi:myo-inositol 2-dehydrogenase/D-chiro-inositol 1-dehydrogenase